MCRGELGWGGKPYWVADGKRRGCSWQALLVCGYPCSGWEEMPNAGIGVGDGGGGGTGDGDRGRDTGGGTGVWFCQTSGTEHLSFLLCLSFLGASEAFSLAECESGLLQYGSALWWWVLTRRNSWLTLEFTNLNQVPWPLLWLRLFWLRR